MQTQDTVHLGGDAFIVRGNQRGAAFPADQVEELREYDVGGIRTNIAFFRQILEDPRFRAGHLHTGFIDEFFARTPPPEAPDGLQVVAALAAVLHSRPADDPVPAQSGSRWLSTGREDLLR